MAGELIVKETGECLETAKQAKDFILKLLKESYILTRKGRQKGTYKLSEHDRQQIIYCMSKGCQIA